MTVFQNYLIENYPTVDELAAELYAQALLYQNPQLPEILDATGDSAYTKDTFYKAAALLLQKDKTEKEQETF